MTQEWIIATDTGQIEVDLRGGNVWRDGTLIETQGLTTNRHFKVLGRLLEKGQATVSYEELLEGIGLPGDNQPVYDIVSDLRKRLGSGLIQNRPGRGYALAWPARLKGVEITPERTPPHLAPSSSVGPAAPAAKSGFWAGEHLLCGTLSVSYGVMVGLALIAEVAYRWPAFSGWVVEAAVIAGGLSSAILALTLDFIRRRADAGRSDAVGPASAVLIVWSVAVALVIAPWLPDVPIVEANFQTMTAKVGFSKSLLEALALPMLSLVPVQVVFALRHQMRAGHASRVQELLGGDRPFALLPGTIVPGPWAATIVFGVVTIWWINANAHLLENLKDGDYFAFFLQVAIVRASVGLLTLLRVLWWYLASVHALKHEAERDTRPEPEPA